MKIIETFQGKHKLLDKINCKALDLGIFCVCILVSLQEIIQHLNNRSQVHHILLCSQDLYCVRSDLGNLLKALGRLEEAKVWC